MAHRSDYSDGGATPAPGNITAADMNGISADLDAAATLTGAQTLTNKTLTSPKVNTILDTNGNESLILAAVGSAVNELTIINNTAGSGPIIRASGDSTDIDLVMQSKGYGNIVCYDGGFRPMFTHAAITSAVNYPLTENSSTGQPVKFGCWGSDTNVDLNIGTKGTGVVKANNVPVATTTDIQTFTNKTLSSPTIDYPTLNEVRDSSGATTVRFDSFTSAVNHLMFQSRPAGDKPAIYVEGPDTDIGLYLVLKGNGEIRQYVQGAGTSATFAADGDATNVSRNFTTKGAGTLQANGVPVATTTDTQTLTNKTITAPILSGSATGTYTLAGTPTITSPAISSPTVSGTPVFSTGIPATEIPNGITNGNTSRQSQAVVSGTSYYITGSNLNLPATLKAGMAVGTRFRWRVAMDKTAAGTGAFAIEIRRGTAGTTADTADVSQSVGTQTAVIDNMVVDVEMVVTTTGATGAYYWTIVPVNTVSSTTTAAGFGVPKHTAAFFAGTVSSVAMNTASLKFGLSFKATTGTPTISIPLVQASAINIC